MMARDRVLRGFLNDALMVQWVSKQASRPRPKGTGRCQNDQLRVAGAGPARLLPEGSLQSR